MELEDKDIVIVISDGSVYDVFVRQGLDLSIKVIDLDTGDIADDRDYEYLAQSEAYVDLEGGW